MGVMTTPCYMCKHFKVDQVDQFTYHWYCPLDKREIAFETIHGCYRFKDKRKKKDRGDPNRKVLDGNGT